MALWHGTNVIFSLTIQIDTLTFGYDNIFVINLTRVLDENKLSANYLLSLLFHNKVIIVILYMNTILNYNLVTNKQFLCSIL